MKRFALTLIALTMQCIALSAAELNIIQENNKAEVFLNGKSLGYGSAYNVDVKPGSHHIKVALDGETIYSKIVEVYDDQSNTFDTTRFVEAGKSKIANIGAQKIETQRIKDAKGSLGVGFQLGSAIGGISIKKYFTEKIGVQTLFWANHKEPNYKSFYGRLLYNIADKTFIADRLVSLYAGIGYGTTSRQLEEMDVEDKEFIKKETRQIAEYFIGAEMPYREYAFLNLEVAFVNIDASRTYFDNLPDNVSEESGNSHDIRLSAGIHIYF